jgi:glycosyltransferase involved in cell wall biosynthesis
MADPLISVIIPAYNAERYIDEALRSVLDQGYPALEVIVVDDGSRDGTADRVAAYGPTVSCYRRATRGGPGVTRNAGIERSRGTYLCFLDADDVMLPGRIALQAEFLTNHPEVGLVFMNYRNFTSEGPAEQTHFQTCARLSGALGGRTSLILGSEEATALLLRENFGLPSSAMIRRTVLERVAGFATDLQTSQDFHFFYRIACHYAVGVINTLGALRRLHDGNITRNSMMVLHNYLRSRSSLRETETRARNRKLLDAFLRRCELDLARAYADERKLALAFAHNWRALSASIPSSPGHLGLGLLMLARTAAIGLGLKKPGR